MYRAGAHILNLPPRVHGAIVTGESLGQVSSQGLRCLTLLSQGLEFPILRPLLGEDKPEIVAQAKRIGTAPPLGKGGGVVWDISRGQPATAPRPKKFHGPRRPF